MRKLGISIAGLLLYAATSFAETNKPFFGLCYGPFRQGQNPNYGIYPSEAEIREDITNKLVYLATSIRTYGNESTLYKIPEFCNSANLECYPAAWIDNYSEDTNQVARLIQIGNAGYSTTKGLIVGTEFLWRNGSSESTLVGYINQVKAATGKQVTANEQWHIYRDYPTMANAVDFILINVHPYWEQVNITNAANFVLEKYNYVKSLYPGKKVMIGETGWPSSGPSYGTAVPSAENQARFVREFTAIAKSNGIEYLAFEAFDEPWKGEGGVGAYWGLLDKNRTLKQGTYDYLKSMTEVVDVELGKIGVQTFTGNKYSLEMCSSLISTNWSQLGTFTGTGVTTDVACDLGTNRIGIVRVKLLL